MDLAALTDDELKTELTTWAARVAAGEARLLALIAELDTREAWGEHGVRSCAHWLAWRLGCSMATARERVRVARSLRDLPQVSLGLAEGRLSFAQARAITRIATPADQHTWVELARHCTAAQLERTIRGARQALTPDQAGSQEPFRAAFTQRWHDDGSCTVSFTLPAEVAPILIAVLDDATRAEAKDRDARLAQLHSELSAAAAGESSQDASAETPSTAEPVPVVPLPYEYEEPPFPDHLLGTPGFAEAQAAWRRERDRRRALRDAWRQHEHTVLAEAAKQHLPTDRPTLTDGLIRLLLHPDRPVGDSKGRVVVKLQHDPVTAWTRTLDDLLIPPTTLDAIRRLVPVQNLPPGQKPLDLTACDQGRRSRTAPPALRSLLGSLDGERCRFPGCDRTYYLHAHHVIFWALGGRTDLDNMILVCEHHHRYLHEHGYQLTLHPDRRLAVRTSNGTDVARRTPLPRVSAETLPTVPARKIPTGGSFDLGYVVNVMLAHAA